MKRFAREELEKMIDEKYHNMIVKASGGYAKIGFSVFLGLLTVGMTAYEIVTQGGNNVWDNTIVGAIAGYCFLDGLKDMRQDKAYAKAFSELEKMIKFKK